MSEWVNSMHDTDTSEPPWLLASAGEGTASKGNFGDNCYRYNIILVSPDYNDANPNA